MLKSAAWMLALTSLTCWNAMAAPIIWGTATTIAGDTDVSTTGTFKYAYNWAGADQTVNGVTFTGTTSITAGGGDVVLAGFDARESVFTSTSAPFASLSAAYQATLAGSPYNAGEPVTVTLNNLTPGNQYAVQIWCEDPRPPGNGRTATLTNPGGNSVTLNYNSTNADGGVGQYSIGIFTATAAPQVFTIDGNASPQLNALQVRDLGIPTSITWGGATTIAGDSDVSTAGTFKYAYHWNTGDQTVNGAPFASLSTAYQATLAGAPYNAGEPVTVTLNNLTPGNQYAVQIWCEDPRPLGNGRTATLTSPGGNSVTLDYNSTDTDGGVGQYSIGIFTATAAPQVFTIDGNASSQLNALQVRDLGIPTSITWGGATTIAGDSDVSTAGTFNVNGVTFTGTTSFTGGGSDVGLAGFAGATDWLKDARLGVFMHFWANSSNDMKLVDAFDVSAVTRQLKEMGAGYLVLTLGQNAGFYNSPNSVYDRFLGCAPGEHCSRRDLPLELYRALQPEGIRLMLYLPCQTPNQDARAQRAFGLPEGQKDQPINEQFARNWAQVIHEWSARYGDKVAGWWFDGGFPSVNFNETIAGIYADAVKRANPRAIVTFNPGVSLVRHTRAEDYTAGELNEPFKVLPASRWVGGSQWHALTYLGSSWGHRNTRHPAEDWIRWVSAAVDKGGVVTLDLGPNANAATGPVGAFSEIQAAQFKAISQALSRSAPQPK